MNQKKITYFWIGFIVSTAATTWLYWLWRRSRVVAPAPLIISRSDTYQPVVDQVYEEGEPPDELDVISGIGPATARRLNEAGITTYKQLGKLSPEQLQNISGTNRWDPNEWIEQAKKLGGQA